MFSAGIQTMPTVSGAAPHHVSIPIQPGVYAPQAPPDYNSANTIASFQPGKQERGSSQVLEWFLMFT